MNNAVHCIVVSNTTTPQHNVDDARSQVEDPLEEANKIAEEIASRSPDSVALTKQLLNDTWNNMAEKVRSGKEVASPHPPLTLLQMESASQIAYTASFAHAGRPRARVGAAEEAPTLLEPDGGVR